MTAIHWCFSLALAGPTANDGAVDAKPVAPPAPVTNTFEVRQTVKLAEIPKGSKKVALWVCVPDDTPQQRVLDMTVVSAPAGWRMVTEPVFGNRFLYCEVANPQSQTVEIVVTYVAERTEGHVRTEGSATAVKPEHQRIFAEELRRDVPLISVTDEIAKMADECCGSEQSAMGQAHKIAAFVADYADHYSKDPSKPKCGRGAAEDCLAQKGGCCTDLHSLFIAMARARGIPARLEFGYRLQSKNDGKEVDPGYRCWVEFFVPGNGWVASDIVVADGQPVEKRDSWFHTLDADRVWCCSGRDYDLVPKQTGPRINTMLIGHAEIDGKWVPVLPSADGKPSPLTRTVLATRQVRN